MNPVPMDVLRQFDRHMRDPDAFAFDAPGWALTMWRETRPENETGAIMVRGRLDDGTWVTATPTQMPGKVWSRYICPSPTEGA